MHDLLSLTYPDPNKSIFKTNWIIFEPQFGPRKYGRWVIYAQPDIIIRINNKIYIIELKSMYDLSKPYKFDKPTHLKTVIENFPLNNSI